MEDNLEKSDGLSILEKHLESRKKYALNLHKEILNRLWAGNGAGVVTILTALQPQKHIIYLASLLFFVFGLIVLGIGAVFDLSWVRDELQDIEDALKRGGKNPILYQHGRYFSAPSHQVWLTWTDCTAIAAFMAGVLVGFSAALFDIFH